MYDVDQLKNSTESITCLGKYTDATASFDAFGVSGKRLVLR